MVRVGRVGDPPVALEVADLATTKAQASAVQAAYLSDPTYLGDFTKNIQMQGVTSEYLPALKPRLIQGVLPSAADYQDQRPVAALTSYGAKVLFPKKAAVGQSVQGYRVIGVVDLPKDEQQGFRSAEQTEFGALGFVPYGSKGDPGGQITYQGPSATLRFLPFAGREAEATEQLSAVAQRRWGNRVTLGSNAQIGAAYRQSALRGALVLALMGLGGLLVAGLSVLALMLSRVLARQRQLGMAAALGASRARLRAQFLLEILLLGTAGSLAGAGFTAALLGWLTQDKSGPFGPSLTPDPLVLVGTAIGGIVLSVLFGLAPAVQASRVRPAEALRA